MKISKELRKIAQARLKAPLQFWIGTQPNPDDRTIIEVSPEDAAKLHSLPRDTKIAVEVTDTKTYKVVRVRRAYCGASCMCALEFYDA